MIIKEIRSPQSSPPRPLVIRQCARPFLQLLPLVLREWPPASLGPIPSQTGKNEKLTELVLIIFLFSDTPFTWYIRSGTIGYNRMSSTTSLVNHVSSKLFLLFSFTQILFSFEVTLLVSVGFHKDLQLNITQLFNELSLLKHIQDHVMSSLFMMLFKHALYDNFYGFWYIRLWR